MPEPLSIAFRTGWVLARVALHRLGVRLWLATMARDEPLGVAALENGRPIDPRRQALPDVAQRGHLAGVIEGKLALQSDVDPVEGRRGKVAIHQLGLLLTG